MYGVLAIFVGLISAYLLLEIIYDEMSFVKTISLLIGLYFSFVALSGFYMNFLGFPLSPKSFLVFFSVLALVEYIYVEKKQLNLEIDVQRAYALGFLALILICVFYYIPPSYPSLLPGLGTDGGRHFALTEFIQENQINPFW